MTAEIVKLPSATRALPAEGGLDLKTAAARIRALSERISTDIISIGIELIAVKKMLGHGQFGTWLESEFRWSGRTARRFMLAAEIFGSKMDSVSVLEPSVIYLLSAPSTPDQVRKYVLALLERGRALPAADIRKLVSGARASLPSLKGSIEAWMREARKLLGGRGGVAAFSMKLYDLHVEIAGGQWIPKPLHQVLLEAPIQTVAWLTIMREAGFARERVKGLVDLVFPAPPVGDHAAENGRSDRAD